MRHDVHNVISERPKSRRTWESKTPRSTAVVLDVLGDQMREDSNHVRQERQKHRKSRFNILERFLVNRVGRAWDKIYAEVCCVADSRSFQGAEVRDYLKAFVATECWLDGRTVMAHDCCGRPQAVQGLYVHPKSRLLLRKERVP